MVDIPALLKAYGAPDNAANVNALTQRYASDPTAADRKIQGLQGQSDESGGSRDAILNMMIDQVAQQAAPAQQALPVSPMVQNSSVPTRKSATAGTPRGEQYGPVAPPQEQYGPTSRVPVNPLDNAASPQGTPVGTSDWDWLLGPLLGILGGGAVAGATMRGRGGPAAAAGRAVSEFRGPEATYAGPMNKEVGPATTRMRTGRLANDSSGAPPVADTQKAISQSIPLDNRAPSTVTGSPENEILARKAQVQAELDAANAEGNAIMNQLKGRKQFKPAGAMRNVTGRNIRK